MNCNTCACIRSLPILTILLILAACATLPEGFERPDSFAYSDTDNTRLGRAFYDETTAHPGQSGFLLLAGGLDAFVARAVLAQHADRSIDAQYYLYHDDLTGRLFYIAIGQCGRPRDSGSSAGGRHGSGGQGSGRSRAG